MADMDEAIEELDGRALNESRAQLAEQRREIQRRLRAMRERSSRLVADREESNGRAEAERKELEFSGDEAARQEKDAQTVSEDRVAKSRQASVRKKLARLDVDKVKNETDINRRLAEIAAEESIISDELEHNAGALNDVNEKLTEMERVREARRARELGRQADRTRELEEQLEELAPLVEAQREAAGLSGVSELSKDYLEQAMTHGIAWKRWGGSLVVAMIATVGAGLFLFAHDKVSTGEITGPTIVDLVRNLFVIGLLLYAVRMTSLQFRVHRHLEAVARNKAAALSTFNRIVGVASEKEIRNSLAVVLAQSVFVSDETGFVDSAQDHITLIERLAAAAPRMGASR